MRNLVLLGLLLWGSAGEVTLYTVTVKTSPAFQGVTFELWPPDKNGVKQAKVKKTGSTATFTVPPGKYGLYAAQGGDYIAQFEPNAVAVTVKSNMTVSLPVKPLPVITNAARRLLNGLLIDITASTEDCNEATVSDLCARVAMSPQNVLSFISLHRELVQTRPWQSYKNTQTADFKLGNEDYFFFVEADDDGSFLVFTRQ